MSELFTGFYGRATSVGIVPLCRSVAREWPSRGASWQGGEPQTNPYAPTYMEPKSEVPSEPISPRRITVDEVISKSWLIFKKHWAMTCVVVAIIGGINFAMNMAQNLLVNVANVAINEPAVTIGIQFLVMAVIYVLQIWLQLGQTMVMLDVARGRPIIVSKLFAGGPYLLRGVVAMVAFTLCTGAIGAVLVGIPAGAGYAATQSAEGALLGAVIGVLIAIAPILFVALAISQYLPLIVDQNLGGLESLQKSYEITNGNKFTLLLVGVVLFGITLAAMIVGLLMLCIGIIPAMLGVGAFSGLVFAVAYLAMTGQRIVVPGSTNDPTSSQFTNVIP